VPTDLGLSMSVPEAVGYMSAAVVMVTFVVSVVVSSSRRAGGQHVPGSVEPGAPSGE